MAAVQGGAHPGPGGPAAPRVKLLTLVVVTDRAAAGAPRVLLGRKKRGFGEGLWNGFGGKVEPGETVEDAARRELVEECGLAAPVLSRAGVLTFEFDDQPLPWEVHVFEADAATVRGEPMETDEMAPAWFDGGALPFDGMWADDPLWYPLLLAGRQFQGTFRFVNTHTLVEHELKAVGALPPLPGEA